LNGNINHNIKETIMLRDKINSGSPLIHNNAVAPKKATPGSIKVKLLQSARIGRNGEVDPRQWTQGRNGVPVQRQAVLMNLVGVEVNGVMYPDPTGKASLPPLNSQEFKELMATPCGLYVESLFGADIERLRKDVVEGRLQLPITIADFDEAVAVNRLNTALATAKPILSQLGYITIQQWTINDIVWGTKSIIINFLDEAEGDAFVAGFKALRVAVGFESVALEAHISPKIFVNDLTVNGISTPSYRPEEVYFNWVAQKGAGGRQVYTLDPAKAISGAEYVVNATSAANAQDLARRSASAAPTRLGKNLNRNSFKTSDLAQPTDDL
jgi:hypothetical protein